MKKQVPTIVGWIALFALSAVAQVAHSETKKSRVEESQSKEKAALETDKGLPLEAADQRRRSLAFATDEATWLSVDIFPDGKRLIPEVLGDLYVLPIEGRGAEPWTTGMALDTQPAVSPDGKWVAFLSDRDGAENLWVAPADKPVALEVTPPRSKRARRPPF